MNSYSFFLLSAALLGLSPGTVMAQSRQETELDIASSKIDVVFSAPVSDTVKKLVLQRIELSARAAGPVMKEPGSGPSIESDFRENQLSWR
jgi:hypothetical protein